MATDSVNRERYREYAHYLRLNAEYVSTSVAPDRLEYLRGRVNQERGKFMGWLVAWLVVAVVCLIPILTLMAVEFGLPLPVALATRAEAFHFQMVTLESAAVVAITIGAAIAFPAAVAIAYVPILANVDAISDLEVANRALKSAEKTDPSRR